MKAAAGFLLAVGCLWATVVVWMFLTLAGVAGAPVSWIRVAAYWCGLLVGPLVLILGAALLLRGAPLRPGVVLAAVGCLILTASVLYNSAIGMQRGPLQAPPPYFAYAILLLIMILSDAAAFKIYRALGGLRHVSRR